MKDIFEVNKFYYSDFFEKSSFFVVLIFVFLFFVLKYFLKKEKNIENVRNEYILPNIDFSQELEKIKNKSLKKYLELFCLFLEEKTWKKNILKMTLEEFKNLENLEEEKIFFEKIYLKIYSWEKVLEKEKEEFFEDLKSFLKEKL